MNASSIKVIEALSPNYDERRPHAPIDILLLHYTGMQTGAAALERLTDPSTKVSAHYLIEEDGTIYRLVAEAHRAWHAGKSFWSGEHDVNSRSIGIELVNPGMNGATGPSLPHRCRRWSNYRPNCWRAMLSRPNVC